MTGQRLGGSKLRIDSRSGASVAIETEHAKVHDEEMFYAYVEDLDLDTAEVISISLTTPVGKICHMFWQIFMSVAGSFVVLEAGTVTANSGSQFTVLNRWRPSVKVSGVFNFETVPVVNKVTLNGTLGGSPVSFGGEGFSGTKTFQNAQNRASGEWGLKPATNHSFKLLAAADNAVASISLGWYEIEYIG